jgi:Cys-tRNA(Pro)/Cys-tRNA(Cys) deacylase
MAMKILDGKGIQYEALTYDAGERDAERVAAALGVPPAEVFKTLVASRPNGKALLVMIPADRQLDLKKLAAAIGEKKVKMFTQREAEALTGMQAGGISALALLNRGFSCLLDDSAQARPHIYVSGGRRGLDLKLAVADLVRITGARLAGVT